jgi:hypothetical protein
MQMNDVKMLSKLHSINLGHRQRVRRVQNQKSKIKKSVPVESLWLSLMLRNFLVLPALVAILACVIVTNGYLYQDVSFAQLEVTRFLYSNQPPLADWATLSLATVTDVSPF